MSKIDFQNLLEQAKVLLFYESGHIDFVFNSFAGKIFKNINEKYFEKMIEIGSNVSQL